MIQINKINGYEDILDIYFISKEGNVYSKKINRFLKVFDNGKGYKYVSLKVTNNKTSRKVYIHRLVAQAFVPKENSEFLQVNHKDEDKSNNNFNNLEWVTSKENNNYGTKNYRCKISRCKKIYVFDYKLNFIGEYLGMKEATEKTIGYPETKGANRRIKNFFYLDENKREKVIKIAKKSIYKTVVLEDITTGKKMIFATTRELRDKFFNGKVNVTDAIKHNWIVNKKYKVSNLNYTELIDSPNLQE